VSSPRIGSRTSDEAAIPARSAAPPVRLPPWLLASLKAELLHVGDLPPHQRGYAFEAFLKRAFDASGLAAREPFRNTGEQIDGSFVLGDEVYLFEAKWQAALTPAADLHVFHGKLDQKAAWTRGLFVSFNGFTPEASPRSGPASASSAWMVAISTKRWSARSR